MPQSNATNVSSILAKRWQLLAQFRNSDVLDVIPGTFPADPSFAPASPRNLNHGEHARRPAGRPNGAGYSRLQMLANYIAHDRGWAFSVILRLAKHHLLAATCCMVGMVSRASPPGKLHAVRVTRSAVNFIAFRTPQAANAYYAFKVRAGADHAWPLCVCVRACRRTPTSNLHGCHPDHS